VGDEALSQAIDTGSSLLFGSGVEILDVCRTVSSVQYDDIEAVMDSGDDVEFSESERFLSQVLKKRGSVNRSG